MFRKTILALAATAAVAGAALTPTTASAWGWKYHHHWHGPHWGYGFYAPIVYGDPCFERIWVETPYGPRLRRVNVCY